MDVSAPTRQIRASYDDSTVAVYQAYSPQIAEPAVAAGTFVSPFKRERMTWIKPSFLWMMYRCGWGRKPGQGITEIRDVTDQARRIHELVIAGQLSAAGDALPVERPYPLSAEISAVIGTGG
ncbi:DUF4291 family protein [Nocardia sp. CA-120079]|uniref:DUF4291 family protein n=1 Tax=Nocardia sp. CA-120079 TaxID=3239974 RepID=UPI003D98D8CC